MDFLVGQLPRLSLPIGQAIAYVEEGVLLPADIHKGRLHPRQDILHLAPVDIAHQMGSAGPLKLHHLQFAIGVVHHGQPGFLRHHIG